MEFPEQLILMEEMNRQFVERKLIFNLLPNLSSVPIVSSN